MKQEHHFLATCYFVNSWDRADGARSAEPRPTSPSDIALPIPGTFAPRLLRSVRPGIVRSRHIECGEISTFSACPIASPHPPLRLLGFAASAHVPGFGSKDNHPWAQLKS
jgi:hypothetical protein